MVEKVLDIALDLTTTAVLVLEENPRRRYCLLVNDSDATAYLMLGKIAVVNTGIRLNSGGGSYEINFTNPWAGKIYALSTGATKRLTILEI